MNTQKSIKTAVFFTLLTFMLNSCGTPGDARKSSPNPRDRAAKNLEEGKGFDLEIGKNKSGDLVLKDVPLTKEKV